MEEKILNQYSISLFKGKKLKDSEIELLKSGKSILEDTPNNEEMKIIRLTAIYR